MFHQDKVMPPGFAVVSVAKDLGVFVVYDHGILIDWRFDPEGKSRGFRDPVKVGPHGIAENDPKWKNIKEYSVPFRGDFFVISRNGMLILTDSGSLYRLVDGKAEHIVSVEPAAGNSAETESDTTAADASNPSTPRLVLMEDQDKKNSVLFQWAGEELTPLDVQNKEKQNIEPFLPAKDVNPKIIKAATVMLKQMEKDEQEVAEFRKELEAKKKAQAEEDAKKPKSQTLQERLQQN
jgi:hypothetical protein